jgi:hypothetical protein
MQLDGNVISSLLEHINERGSRQFDEGTNSDIEVLQSKIAALEADIRQLKDGNFPEKIDSRDLLSFLEKFSGTALTHPTASLGKLTYFLFHFVTMLLTPIQLNTTDQIYVLPPSNTLISPLNTSLKSVTRSFPN